MCSDLWIHNWEKHSEEFGSLDITSKFYLKSIYYVSSDEALIIEVKRNKYK